MIRRPLDSHPLLRTRDVDHLRAGVSQLFLDPRLAIAGKRRSFDIRMNYRQLRDVGLLYGTYGAGIEVRFELMNFFVQGISLRGTGEHTNNRAVVPIDRHKSGVLWPGATHGLKFSAGFEYLALKMDRAAVIAKLGALLGEPATKPLQFEGDTDFRQPEARGLKRLVKFLSADPEPSSPSMSPLALAECEQAAMVSFLYSNRHNYSDLIERRPQASASWQVRIAEEYIAAHWDQPINVEELSMAAGSSVRSLFLSFKQSRCCSPMTFVKQVRLQHARQMLTNPTAALSVIDVAFACGFGNPGHFAKDYRQKFGELPSVALGRGKGIGRP